MGLRVVKLGAVLAAGFLLASCATMSPEECKVADWREVGQRDGLNGKPLSHLHDRAEDCGKVGVAINTQAYTVGRNLGLRSYCRLENAVPLGLAGGSYAGVCPPEIDQVFQYRFQVARAVHDLRTDVKNLDDRTVNLERQLRDINYSEERRLKEATTDEQRKKVRQSIDDERRHIRGELSDADRQLRRKRDELRSAEYALGNLR
ncbi:MAG: DUF2799 domain-containing protein [Burkholderiales bacterium]